MKFCWIVFAVLAGAYAHASDVLLNNGFERSVAGSDPFPIMQGGSGLGGWHVDAADMAHGVAIRSNRYGPNYIAQRGNQSVQMGGINGPGDIFQTVTVDPFAAYLIFIGNMGEGIPTNNTWEMLINGNHHWFSGQPGNHEWYGYSEYMGAFFTSTVEIRFRATGAPGGVILDEIYLFKDSDSICIGHIGLSQYDGSLEDLPVTFEYYDQTTHALVNSFTFQLDPSGGYKFDAPVPHGNYDVYAKASHWLRRKVSGVSIHYALNENDYLGPNALINGDVDGSNVIDLGDFDLLASAFGHEVGEPEFDPNADLDGSGVVDLGDFDILAGTFGMEGD